MKLKIKQVQLSLCHLEMLKNISMLLLDGPPKKLAELSPELP